MKKNTLLEAIKFRSILDLVIREYDSNNLYKDYFLEFQKGSTEESYIPNLKRLKLNDSELFDIQNEIKIMFINELFTELSCILKFYNKKEREEFKVFLKSKIDQDRIIWNYYKESIGNFSSENIYSEKLKAYQNELYYAILNSIVDNTYGTKKGNYQVNITNQTIFNNNKQLKGIFNFTLKKDANINIEYREDVVYKNGIFIFNSNGNNQSILIANYNSDKIYFDEIDFFDFREFNSINIRGIEIRKLIIKNLDNTSNFVITDCYVHNLEISDSDLGKIKFNGVKIGKLTIENTTLNDSIFNGVNFISYELGKSIDGKNITLEKIKDNYRQLKFVMDKNGNHTEANKFYVKEMESYMDELNISKKKNLKDMVIDGFSDDESARLGEKIALRFNYTTSIFSSNLARILFMIFLYLLILYSGIFLAGFIQSPQTINELIFHIQNIDYTNSDLVNLFDIMSDISLFIFIIYLLVFPKIDYEKEEGLLEKFTNRNFLIISVLIIIFFGLLESLSSLRLGDFHGFKTLAFIINPLSGLDYDFISTLLWTEQIGLVLHKIIYGTLIYQLIVTLRRTTRR